ncbi:alpha-1,2-galactosyltransferase Gmh2 [Schizosaccharomyces pombe]|uniref:Probable alpha-1,2-galactosyltransferase gmh2 n=1 Tax=Schizosaccharomyces pombe (strain 972 / ATCC 24843) TaxID=284812 RepID=GMH2_SCHPO|nr:putative alpha-1,2-galactosyltransferase Gmh2 [Schizosaccharomyces pombe]Q09681.1 RecName: Full=Probable alpha-1,2-galactosyltransferase gmh2 [Schizosaccharomyces pombe 972h-]CAA89963.1 alpha-1,2-galactosyltransferase Gmh2 (predicted) [Schizosaccharomyces pombe]|eukprot:NP_592826.1 putative alpha-1,2-galactosyltransferase Gmh2 [Schizosaccharomyces pombe]
MALMLSRIPRRFFFLFLTVGLIAGAFLYSLIYFVDVDLVSKVNQLYDQQIAPMLSDAIGTPSVNHSFELAPLDSHLVATSTTFHEASYESEPQQNPASQNIVLLLVSDGHTSYNNGANTFEEAIQNRVDYSTKQNYNFEYVNVTGLPIPAVWSKMPAVLQTMKKYPKAEWIWLLDQDAIITNTHLSLQDSFLKPENLQKTLITNTILTKRPINANGDLRYTPSNYSLKDIENLMVIISQDHNGLNAGSILFRNSPATALFLDIWTDPVVAECAKANNEQDMLGYLISKHSQLASLVGLIPQRKINAFHEGPENMEWQKGDLVIHFAGCWVENRCDELWQKFYALID